jgi:hypothetical protein
MIQSTHRPIVTRLGVAASLVCLLALGACGSDDDDAGASAASDSDNPSAPATDSTEQPPTTSAGPTTTPTAATESVESTTTAEPPDSSDETSEPTTPPETSAPDTDASNEPELCEPYLEVSAAFAGEPDPATISDLLDQVDAAAPADIAEQLGVLTDGGRTVLETGDFSVFESPDFGDAVVAADTWVFENCEFVTTTEIVATEYQYDGQADEYPAGRTAFVLVNEGAEAHELVIIRKNDDVELTLAELIELPEADAETMTTYIAGTFVGPTGARSNLVIDLQPGNYIAVCNIPAGTIVADDGSFTEGAGQPHVMLGMSFEFTVE